VCVRVIDSVGSRPLFRKSWLCAALSGSDCNISNYCVCRSTKSMGISTAALSNLSRGACLGVLRRPGDFTSSNRRWSLFLEPFYCGNRGVRRVCALEQAHGWFLSDIETALFFGGGHQWTPKLAIEKILAEEIQIAGEILVLS
jgi:hypothetical protein